MVVVKKFWGILLIGLLIRVVIAAVTYHPDVGNVNLGSSIITRGLSLNPYEFVDLDQGDPKQKIFANETADDLPLQYWIRVPFSLIFSPILNTNIEDRLYTESASLFGNPNFYLYLFYIKLPVIIFDLLVGILLCLMVSYESRRKVLIFWILNPMTLWASIAIGQMDIVPTFFMLLAINLSGKKKMELSALSLGVGGAIKSFPFLLAPFLILQAKSLSEAVKLGILIFIPFLISVLPYLGSATFRQNALFAPQLDKMFYAKIPISGGEGIIINLVILGGLYLWYLIKNKKESDFLYFSTAGLLLLLSFTHFHLQWFLWVTPLLVLLYPQFKVGRLNWSFVFLGISLTMMLFLFDASLQLRLFSPLIPVLKDANGLFEVLSSDQLAFFRSIAVSIFAAAAISISTNLLYESKK